MTIRDTILALLLGLAYLTATATEPREERPTDSRTDSTVGSSSVRDGRTGTITHMGAGYPASYLAIPIGPGHRVTICGPARCLTMTSTDAGPNRAMLQAGRIADVSVQTFERLCGCPASRGTFQGSWRVGGPAPTLPPTDTAS